MLYILVTENGNIRLAVSTPNNDNRPELIQSSDKVVELSDSLFSWDLDMKNYDFESKQIVVRE